MGAEIFQVDVSEESRKSKVANSAMVKERADHQPVVTFTNENMGAYKPVPVVIIPPVRFIGCPARKGRTVSIQGSWDPERSVAVITTVGIPMEGALADIGMETRNLVIHMECDGEASWVKSLGEVCPNQSVDQWMDCITNTSSGEEVPNIDFLIAVFSRTKKNDGRPDLYIKSWSQPVKALGDLL